MSKPWKQIKIFTADVYQSVTIGPNPERDAVCIRFKDEIEKPEFCLYATYDEALAIAEELINFVKQR